MKRIPSDILEFYDTEVVKMMMEKYNMEYMEALVLFCTSKTHEMLENEDCGMTMFGAGGIFNIWECEKITGDPRNSVYIRGE